MTTNLSCPDHGDLALRVARGEADPGAEAVARECAQCAAVLEGLLAVPWAEEVALGVGEGFASVELPARGRRWVSGLIAAAAVLLMAAGAAFLARTDRPAPRQAAAVELVERVFDPPTGHAADLNQDGRVDAADLALALQQGGSPTPRS